MANYQKICDYCKEPFESKRNDAVYCSPSCRSMANRKNKGLENWLENSKEDLSVSPSKQRDTSRMNESEFFAWAVDEMNQVKDLLIQIKDSLSRDEKILTIGETCRMLDISRPTFERYQSQGKIVVHHFGKDEKSRGRNRKPYVLFSELVHTLKRGDVSKVERNRLNDGQGN